MAWRTVILLFSLWLGLQGVAISSAEAVVLGSHQTSVSVWPAVRMLSDPDKSLGIGEVMGDAVPFVAPSTAHGTLGLRKDAVWLRIPVSLLESTDPQAADTWLLHIDYPPLNRIDVYLTAENKVLRHAVVGNVVARDLKPVPGRSPAVDMQLRSGVAYVLYLRVETMGAMILPMTLSRPAVFHTRALNEQMLQGLLTGVALCLLIYSLGQWLTLREHLFVKYAILISGSLLFCLLQFGIGMQYVWVDNLWFEQHAGGLSAFLASTGSFLFIEQALAGPDMKPWLGRLMKLGALLNVVFATCYALDWVDVHTVTSIVSILGLAPALMGMPGAIRRARRGESVGIYFLLAWLVYFVSTALLIEVIKGRLPANFWTLHSFQFGAIFDMLVFMRVLGLRTKVLQAAVRQATRERDKLHTLAHTDPLTGLPNRRSLNATISAQLEHTGPENILAVFLMDLDGFKQINDQYGHDTGDELLIAVAQRLQAQLRNSDIVSRLGGDEFVVMSSGLLHPEQAQELGEKLVRAFDLPFVLSHQTCSVGLTIGYALAPLDERDLFGLLRLADAAMYAGKQDGKHCVRRAPQVTP